MIRCTSPTFSQRPRNSRNFPAAPALLILLDESGIACSGGSACHTAQLQPSHVLDAMNINLEQAQSTLRFSFSRFNTPPQVDEAAQALIQCVRKLQDLHPPGSPVLTR